MCMCVCAEGEVWICKPTGMNQGKGIYLVKTPAEVDQLRETKGANHIIQRYSLVCLKDTFYTARLSIELYRIRQPLDFRCSNKPDDLVIIIIPIIYSSLKMKSYGSVGECLKFACCEIEYRTHCIKVSLSTEVIVVKADVVMNIARYSDNRVSQVHCQSAVVGRQEV